LAVEAVKVDLGAKAPEKLQLSLSPDLNLILRDGLRAVFCAEHELHSTRVPEAHECRNGLREATEVDLATDDVALQVGPGADELDQNGVLP